MADIGSKMTMIFTRPDEAADGAARYRLLHRLARACHPGLAVTADRGGLVGRVVRAACAIG
jgi:hypothetical protein